MKFKIQSEQELFDTAQEFIHISINLRHWTKMWEQNYGVEYKTLKKKWETKMDAAIEKLKYKNDLLMEEMKKKYPAWTKWFDWIVVLNLDERTDRMETITQHFAQYSIPFQRVSAIKNENGEEGVYQSLVKIFTDALAKGFKKILIFEDDAEIVFKLFDFTLFSCLHQLPDDWDQFLLGLNALCPFEKFYSPNLLNVRMSYSLHASAYSEKFMIDFLKLPKELPVDVMIAKTIMQRGKTYCSYPMLVNQRVSSSDVGKWTPNMPGVVQYWNSEYETVDWGRFMEDQYQKNIKHLLK